MKKKVALNFIIIVALTLMFFIPVETMAQQWGLYTLYATKNGTKAYLIDTSDSPVTYKTWTFPTNQKSAYSAYLIAGDTLVRTYKPTANTSWNSGGIHGGIQKVTWDGTVAWDFQYYSSTYCAHHDICALPNGNVLLISYEIKSTTEATQAGSSQNKGYWSDKIVEVKPTGPTTGTIVWEWKLWDHLCQNYNPSKDNYVTSIVDNPQLMNINYVNTSGPPSTYLDWWHMNGIDYNEELDQIVVSAHFMNSAFIIDHSTTTTEAAGHTGGNSGKGGDFLYRWGNPASYGATGTTIFNTIHDAHWISSDNVNYPNYLAAYNNNGGTGGKTAVDIWNPPYNGNNYNLTLGQAYAPSNSAYQYTSVFTANNEGNSQQLPNGNMIVNNFQGSIYEVNSTGTTIWTKAAANSTHAYRYTKCFVRGPIANAGSSLTTVCSGTQINLSSSGTSVTETNPTYSYTWESIPAGFNSASQNPTDMPLVSTTYLVTVTNTALGCSDTAHVFVNVNNSPAIPTISENQSILTSSTALSYQWYFNSSILTGETSQSLSPTADGLYQVVISDANGCTSISNPYNYIGTAITESQDKKELVVYPNPTSGILTIENVTEASLILTNSLGAVLETRENVNSMDLSKYPNGIYYIAVRSNEGLVSYQKIVLIK